MKRIISAIIILCFSVVGIFGLFSCSYTGTSDSGESEKNGDTENSVFIPEYKDYGRGTIDFSEIKYSRPDVEKLIDDFGLVCKIIDKNEIDFESQIEKIKALEDSYSNFLTMQAYSTIRFHAGVSDSFWSDEYDYISTSTPGFSKAVEALFVSAANSPHAEKFEEEYFGENLIEDYKGGGIYTEEVVSLMTREAELEAEYSALSDEELDGRGRDITVELFKVRRKISDALGHSSYATFAYDAMGHGYSEEDFLKFSEDIAAYVMPVYLKLSGYIFNQSTTLEKQELASEKVINDTGKMLKGANEELYEIYSYMLQHSLFNVKGDTPTRFDGAFTTYFDSYNAPFIFITASKSVTDYTTLCHEFGHFADMYINYSSESALDLSEISSQALELLALTEFEDEISSEAVDVLTVLKMEDVLSCLVFQGFYAVFEHIAYQIPYEEISEETLNHAVALAAEKMGLNSAVINNLNFVMIPHVVLCPFYVQAYCTSVTASLEIYFAELDKQGAGFDAYVTLLRREDKNLTFLEELSRAGLTSPFEKGFLKSIADRIHYELLGSHYFKTNGSADNAA